MSPIEQSMQTLGRKIEETLGGHFERRRNRSGEGETTTESAPVARTKISDEEARADAKQTTTIMNEYKNKQTQ